ncbi:hypothetical protein PG991_000495 [Apiospora marii]|uniref:Uncharacterized protein n=1 Tax=Apiospora marii TaxID=335849 RepID=A0ABR1T293_9PEZI
MEDNLQIRSRHTLLEAAQLKVHELASALAIGTRFGSIFTRSEDAQLFDSLAQGAGVHVRDLPWWLYSVRFSRSTLVHGDNMRHITNLNAMGSIHPKTLEGLATFVILCCQWTQSPHTTACRLVRDLLTGELSPIVDPGALRNAPGSVTSKLEFLVQKFVRATMASDANSPQSRNVRDWLKMLSEKAGRVSFAPIPSDRLFDSDRQLLASMLGRAAVTSRAPVTVPPSQMDDFGSAYARHKDSRMHDTVSIVSAAMALAAAGNGAEVYVECHTVNDVFYLPQRPANGLDDSLKPLFLIRLWLCQPPPYVSKTIGSESVPTDSSQNVRTGPMMYPTIFGGQAELRKAVAEIIEYRAKFISDTTREEAIMILWDRCFEYGSRLRLQRATELWQADFYLEFVSSPTHNDTKSEVQFIAELLENSGGLREKWPGRTGTQKSLLICIATVLHELYVFESYEGKALKQELLAASALGKIAMTVGVLHQITHSDGGEMYAYAISSELISEGNMILWDFLPNATDQGIGSMCLIQAASALWTGTTADTAFPMFQRRGVASQNATYESTSDHTILGKRGPHGVVLLEILRDPIQLAQHGLDKPVVFFSRGSTPLLAYDPQDGYLLTSKRRIVRNRHGVVLESGLAFETPQASQTYMDPVITIEPDTSDDLKSTVLCAWYGGDLMFEIDPLMAFLNVCTKADNLGKSLLPSFGETRVPGKPGKESSSSHAGAGIPHEESYYASRPKMFPPRSLFPSDFLKHKGMVIENGSAVFRTNSAAWCLCAAGLISQYFISVAREAKDYTGLSLNDGEVVIEFIAQGTAAAQQRAEPM